jgi:hypothetical protein
VSHGDDDSRSAAFATRPHLSTYDVGPNSHKPCRPSSAYSGVHDAARFDVEHPSVGRGTEALYQDYQLITYDLPVSIRVIDTTYLGRCASSEARPRSGLLLRLKLEVLWNGKPIELASHVAEVLAAEKPHRDEREDQRAA